MPTTREEIIADWRQRLALAEDAASSGPSHPAWIKRLRLRLYRFLLSLYGLGEWNASNANIGSESSASLPMTVTDHALPLGGKPAKDEGSIRAALQSFAAGREQKLTAGPLSTTDINSWIVVASTQWNLDPQRTADALQAKGITSRVVARVSAVTVEVLAASQVAAMNVIQSQLRRLSLPTPEQQRARAAGQRLLNAASCPAGRLLLLGLVLAPILGIAAVGCVELYWPEAIPAPSGADLLSIYLPVWLGATAMMTLLYLLIASELRPPENGP